MARNTVLCGRAGKGVLVFVVGQGGDYRSLLRVSPGSTDLGGGTYWGEKVLVSHWVGV